MTEIISLVVLASVAISTVVASVVVFPRFLPPGVPALITLAFAVSSGVLFGFIVSWPRPGAYDKGIAFRAYVTCTVATVFWLWAVYKVIATGDHDLGALSFALVIASTGSVIRAANGLPKRRADLGSLTRFVGGSCAAVAVNYAYVLIKISGLPGSFQLYLVVGTAFWVAAVCSPQTRTPLDCTPLIRPHGLAKPR